MSRYTFRPNGGYVSVDAERPLAGEPRSWPRVGSLNTPFAPVALDVTHPTLFKDPRIDTEFANAHAIHADPTAAPPAEPWERTIHVINLRRRTDRWRRMRHELAAKLRAFQVERVEAIQQRPGWVGCARSHLKVIRWAKDHGWPYVMVAEDDFAPAVGVPLFEQRLLAAQRWLREHPDDWTVFNGLPIGVHYGFVTKYLGDGMVRMNGGQNTHFMIYSERVYDAMLSRWEAFYASHGSDREAELYLAMDYFASDCAEGKMVCTFPPLTRGVFDDSDIVVNYGGRGQPREHVEDIEWVWRTYTRVDRTAMAGTRPFDPESDVTVLMTSCGRWECLVMALTTFFKVNTHPVKRVIVAEDSGLPWMAELIREHFPQVTLLFDGERKGHRARIQQLWALADTKYVFHTEDDWTYRKGFFLETSKRVLEADPTVLNVWLRDVVDTNKHPLKPKLRMTPSRVRYWYLDDFTGDDGKRWHGFTWNPTLYRADDVRTLILAATAETQRGEPDVLGLEEHLNAATHAAGFRSAIVPGAFVAHTGLRSRLTVAGAASLTSS